MKARRESKSPSVVKSAARVLEVVEYISEAADGVTAIEIIRALNYPPSSTSALLKSLTTLGYLFFDRERRTYHATARVALIGARTLPRMFGDGQLLKVMEEINRETGEAVILTMRIDDHVRFIHAIDSRSPIRLNLQALSLRSCAATCSGRLFLSQESDANIRGFVHRTNSEAPASSQRIKIDAFLKDINEIRERGYSVLLTSEYRPGIAGVAELVPQQKNRAPLAIVITGLVEEISANHRQYAQVIRKALSRHFDAANASSLARQVNAG